MYFDLGFELGDIVDGKPLFHNHYQISILYHNENNNNYRVVGVLVEPYR